MNRKGLGMMRNGMGMHYEDEKRCIEFFLAMFEHLRVEGGKIHVDFP